MKTSNWQTTKEVILRGIETTEINEWIQIYYQSLYQHLQCKLSLVS